MARKRKTKHWSRREIDKKLYYGSILFILLLCVLVAFVYAIPAVGIPIETQLQIYFQDLQEGWTNPPPPKPKPIFVHHGRPAVVIAPPHSNFIATTTINCQSVEYTPSQAASFITAYKNEGHINLHLIVVCGTVQDGYATQFTLTTNNGVISGSQFSYHDTELPGPTTKHTCKLSVTSSSSAVVTCGESSFNLSY